MEKTELKEIMFKEIEVIQNIITRMAFNKRVDSNFSYVDIFVKRK